MGMSEKEVKGENKEGTDNKWKKIDNMKKKR